MHDLCDLCLQVNQTSRVGDRWMLRRLVESLPLRLALKKALLLLVELLLRDDFLVKELLVV